MDTYNVLRRRFEYDTEVVEFQIEQHGDDFDMWLYNKLVHAQSFEADYGVTTKENFFALSDDEREAICVRYLKEWPHPADATDA